MNKKRSICYLSLLFTLFLSSTTIAQEMKACDEGISVLDIQAYQMLVNIEISEADVAAYRQLLAGCVARYQSFSTGKRNEFLRLLNTLIARMDEVYLRVSSEGLYRPDGSSGASHWRAQRINEIKQEMQRIYIALLNQRYPLDKGWGNTFVSNLYLGYESTDVDGFTRYGGGRFGVGFYYQIDGALEEKGQWGRHVFGDALLTNSAENSDGIVDDAYEVDLNFFAPYAMGGNSKGRWALGPVVGMKMKKLNGVSISRWKYMAGARLARSSDLYLEGRYGKSEGVSGQRIEVRGQLPVMVLFNGDVIVGGALNLSTDDGASSGDTMQMYLLWQVNFLDVLNVY